MNLGKSHRVPDKAIKYCYQKLKNADEFKNGIDLETKIVEDLTIEELIGAILLAKEVQEGYEELKKDL